MPRKFRGAKITRRIRRKLDQQGYEADVTLIDRPEWHFGSSPNLVETRLKQNGEIHILHHSISIPATDDNVDYIVAMTQQILGVKLTTIEALKQQCGHALRKDEGFIVSERSGFDPIVHLPVSLLDILRNEHQQEVSFPSRIGKMLYNDIQAENTAQDNLTHDKKRRTSSGNPKPIRIGNLFAHFLRGREDGWDILVRVLPFLQSALSDIKTFDGGTIITVDKVATGIPVQGIRWSIKGSDVHLKDYTREQWSIDGDTLLIRSDFPQSIVDSLAGRRLGDVVEGLPLDPKLTITAAKLRKSPWKGVSLKLSGRPILPEELEKELKQKRAEK